MAEFLADYQERKAQERKAAAAPVESVSGFRNTGAIRERGLQTAQLGAEAASVGEPTSFRGGAGAPEPIGVIRGTATTFSPGRLPGNQFAEPEMATPLQAQQAWNRGMAGQATGEADRRGFTDPNIAARYGEYRLPGQTLEEIKSVKEPPSHGEAWRAQAKLYEAQREGVEATNLKTKITNNQATLRKQLEEEAGIPNKEGTNLTLPTDPGFQAIHKKMDRLTLQGVSPEEAYKAVAPELHRHYYTPENLYGAISLMEKQTGQPVPPELRKQLMSGTPEAMEALYPFTRQAAQQPRGVVSRTFSPAPPIQPQPGPGAGFQPGVNRPDLGFVAP